MEIAFYKPKVIHSLDLNLSFLFVTFLSGGWLSKIALILLKKIVKRKIYIFIIVN